MAISLNSKGKAAAVNHINNGKVNRTSGWSFSAEDGNKLLGDPPDWTEYVTWFLATDSDYGPDVKEHYKYPFGKSGEVYRSGLIAVRQRAAQQGETAIYDAAGALIKMIDGDKKSDDALPLLEQRTFTCSEFRVATDKEVRKIVGHAAVFNVEGDGGWFREQIAPGAFTDSIGTDDIRALFNHNPDIVLGRNTAGTLTLKEDERGLHIEIVPPDTQQARDLMVSIERGDITQQSFGFQTLQDTWTKDETGGKDLRTLQKLRLFDVSPVTFPFYRETDVALRSHDNWTKSRAEPGEAFDPPHILKLRTSLAQRR